MNYRGRGPWAPSKFLYDTQTATSIPVTGWTIKNGGTIAFSPGRQAPVVRPRGQGRGPHARDDGLRQVHEEAFSNLVDLGDRSAKYVGWPAFTPDSKWVVYHSDTNAQFETDSGAVGDLR